MKLWQLYLLVSLCPASAFAGAWPRDEGTGFLSTSVTLAAPITDWSAAPTGYGSVFLEYGLGRGRTIGLDAWVDQKADYAAVAFFRQTLGAGQGNHRLAFQAGLGQVSTNAGSEILLQGAVLWGRGIETRLGPGWTAIDASVLYQPQSQSVAVKTDLTLGIRTSDRNKWMLQVQMGDYPGSDPYVRLVPGLARKFGDRTHIEIGTQIGIVGDDRIGVKLGTWLEF